MGCGGVGSKRGLHQHLLSESCFKRSYGSLTCRILCQVFSYIHSFWRFFRKWPRVLFHANLFFMLIVHMHLKLENKWGYSLVNTKSGAGGTWLYFTPYLKAFPVFNVLETCRVYLLTIDLGIVKCVKKTHTNSNWNKIPILTSKTKTGKNNKFNEYSNNPRIRTRIFRFSLNRFLYKWYLKEI